MKLLNVFAMHVTILCSLGDVGNEFSKLPLFGDRFPVKLRRDSVLCDTYKNTVQTAFNVDITSTCISM